MTIGDNEINWLFQDIFITMCIYIIPIFFSIQTDFDALLKSEAGLIVVDFYADWCGPCRIIAPKIEVKRNIFVNINALF